MWKYKGNGFIVGIPSKDINIAEYNLMGMDIQQTIRECGLYELEKPKKNQMIQESEK